MPVLRLVPSGVPADQARAQRPGQEVGNVTLSEVGRPAKFAAQDGVEVVVPLAGLDWTYQPWRDRRSGGYAHAQLAGLCHSRVLTGERRSCTNPSYLYPYKV